MIHFFIFETKRNPTCSKIKQQKSGKKIINDKLQTAFYYFEYYSTVVESEFTIITVIENTNPKIEVIMPPSVSLSK